MKCLRVGIIDLLGYALRHHNESCPLAFRTRVSAKGMTVFSKPFTGNSPGFYPAELRAHRCRRSREPPPAMHIGCARSCHRRSPHRGCSIFPPLASTALTRYSLQFATACPAKVGTVFTKKNMFRQRARAG